MKEHIHRQRDFLQNITIALLSVTAVLLFTQTQVHNLNADSSYLFLLSGADTATSADTAVQSNGSLSAPVRVAVTGPYGRYGSVALTTSDETFEPLRTLLEQALGSAQAYTPVDTQAFLGALSTTPSVYYDFLSTLPLSVLAELASGDIFAQRLVAAEYEGRVALYLWNSNNSDCLRCDTALSPEDLEEIISQYEPSGAFFAFEGTDPNARKMAPYSLFLEENPSLPLLTVSTHLSDADRLLTTLGFNPNTHTRYGGSEGTEEVIVERERTLRIRSDGTVIYQGGGDTALSIKAAGDIPTLSEATAKTTSLLNTILSPIIGEASLYLERIQQNASTTTLHFGYHINGVPIRFSDGYPAALITLSGATVSTMTLRIRQYTSNESTSLLLPLRQALAIAALQPNEELSIGYIDNGSGTANAAWLTDPSID